MFASGTPLVGLQQVGLRYAERIILNHIDFSLHAGEAVALIGPNGAGKSSFIKILLGLQAPTAGKRWQAHGVRFGYVPQSLQLPNSLPLRVGDLLGLQQAKVAYYQKIIADMNLNPLLKQDMQHLSGGERQRVLLARALLHEPHCLILDEPMQGLDTGAEQHFYDYIDGLPEQLGCAVLTISHDLHWVMQGTQRVICLNQHICCTGTPAQIQTLPEFQRLFGYSRLFYEHQHTHCQHDAVLERSSL